MPAVDNLGRFVSVEKLAAERARVDLAEAEAQLAELQARLAAAVSAGNVAEAAALAEDFNTIWPRIEALQEAVAAGRSADEKRLAEAQAREARAKIRAAKAHLSAFNGAIQDAHKTIANLARLHRKAGDAIGALCALLPGAAPWPYIGEHLETVLAGETDRALGIDNAREPLAEAAAELVDYLAEEIAAMAAALPQSTTPDNPEQEAA